MFANDVSLLQLLIAAGLVVSAAYYLVGLYATHSILGRRVPLGALAVPQTPLSILKPLKGADPQLYDNLESLCLQSYPGFQLVCGVADPDDAAIPVVRQLQASHPEVDIALVIDPRQHGSNYKVGNLQNMLPHAKYDLMVIADSDIRVPPDHLRTLVHALIRPNTGIATCLYRAVGAAGLPALIESLFINTDFCAMTLVARKIEKTRYAFGATIALHRQVLQEIGGFRAIANHLADDYQLGQLVAARGYQIALTDQPVDTVITVGSWRALFRHQLRWARTYRICRPRGYFGTIFTHGTLWATANLLYHGLLPAAVLGSIAVLSLRWLWAVLLCQRYLGLQTPLRHFLLLPAKDLFVSLIWVLAFAGDTVWWSGRRFRVLRTGEMVDLTPARPARPELWSPTAVSPLREREPSGRP